MDANCIVQQITKEIYCLLTFHYQHFDAGKVKYQRIESAILFIKKTASLGLTICYSIEF